MLGEFCLEEDRLDWIHIFEVDVRKLLDPQRVGMDQRKEEMGIFTSKGYVFENALSYQDIYDGIHLPDIDGVAGGIFSLRLVGSQYPEEQGTWLELPTTDLGFQWVLNRLNERTLTPQEVRTILKADNKEICLLYTSDAADEL